MTEQTGYEINRQKVLALQHGGKIFRRSVCYINNIVYLRNAMDKKKQDIGYFLSFCIEQYKNAKGMDGTEVIDTFAKYDVFDYLNTHFEILHTQSRQWILEDIDEFINHRKGGDKNSFH